MSSSTLSGVVQKSPLFGNSLIHGILIAVLCLLSYANTFHVPFQLDDSFNISEKPYVRDLNSFFEPAKIGEYRADWPFRMRMAGFFTLAINYRMHGEDVVGYHIVNLLIHIFNGFLVYFLVLLTFGTPYFGSRGVSQYARTQESGDERSPLTPHTSRLTGLFSLFAALLFVSHPIQTQAVTYIVQRFTSLTTLFCLLSLVMYIKWRITQNARYMMKDAGTPNPKSGWIVGAYCNTPVLWYLSSVVSAVLAMKTKEIAFTLPLIIILYEFLFFDGPVKKRLLFLVPFLLTMLIIPLELMGLEVPAGEIIGDVGKTMKVQTDMSRWDYLCTEFRVLVTYIRLLVFPAHQNLDYDYPVYRSFSDPNVFLSFLFLLSLIGLGVYLLYKTRGAKSIVNEHSPLAPPVKGGEQESRPSPGGKGIRSGDPYSSPLAPHLRSVSFGIFWFFITLSVESSVIPIVDVIFEHRLYLPSIGFFIAVTAVLAMAWERLKGKLEWKGKAAACCLFAVVFLLSAATHARNTVWQSQLSLWSDVLQKSPRKVRALSNFGLALMDRGDMDRAADAYARAIALDPTVAEPHYNMGKVYEKKGLHDRAIEEYTKAVSLQPDFADAFFDLGVAYSSKGMREEAMMNYRIALRLKPDYAQAHFNLGVNYLSANHIKEARDEFEAALRLDPTLDQARLFLGYINKKQ